MHTQTRDGVALQLWAPDTTGNTLATQRAQEQIFDLLIRRLPVAVTVAGLDASPAASELFSQVCTLIAVAMRDAAAPAELVTVVVPASTAAPEQLWATRCATLGRGVLYLLVDDELARPSGASATRCWQDEFWMQCWRLRGNSFVRTALAPFVSSPCPLFAPEQASGILPPHGLQVPIGSAWAVLSLDLMHHAAADGSVDYASLDNALRYCIEQGERAHDESDWPTAAMHDDSWSNRRLAITVNGIGDLVHLRSADPCRLSTLRDLEQTLQHIAAVANQYSRQLAGENEHAPSLRIAESGPEQSGVIEMAGWQSRWKAALSSTATRHRNLLALSPWAVFPNAATADCRYSELLPLLARGDVCSFPAPPRINSWNINEFNYFHRRLWAILVRKDEQQTIAEQV